MVSFRVFFAAALALTVPVFAKTPLEEMQESCTTLNTNIHSAHIQADSITILSGPLDAVGLGPYPKIKKDCETIFSKFQTLIQQAKNLDSELSIADEEKIAQWFEQVYSTHMVVPFNCCLLTQLRSAET
jgi:hypothetical protein